MTNPKRSSLLCFLLLSCQSPEPPKPTYLTVTQVICPGWPEPKFAPGAPECHPDLLWEENIPTISKWGSTMDNENQRFLMVITPQEYGCEVMVGVIDAAKVPVAAAAAAVEGAKQ